MKVLITLTTIGVVLTACANVPKPEKSPVKTSKVSLEDAQPAGNIAGSNNSSTTLAVNSAPVTNDKTKFSSKEFGVAGSPRVQNTKLVRKGGGRYQVGKPYTVRGRKYYPREDTNYKATGLASWYGPNFHGRLTANGEVYDQYALSAAHPTLPLPSYVRVTNLENNSSVVVRVNDRGPFSKKRVIDLSARAAELLGYTHKGLAKVKVEYAGKAPLDGLDEKRLVASYKPGRMDVRSIPPNGRGEILVADAQPASKRSNSVQSFVSPQPTLVNSTSRRIHKIVPVPRPTTTLLNSYAPSRSANARMNAALVWFNSK